MLSITFKMSSFQKALKSLEPYKRPVKLWKLPQPEPGQENLFTVAEQYEQMLISPVLGAEGRAALVCYNHERRLKTRVEIPVKVEGEFSRPLYVNYWAVKQFAAQYKEWPEINIIEFKGHINFVSGLGKATLLPMFCPQVSWPVISATAELAQVELIELIDGLKCVIGAAMKEEEVRPVLNSVLLEINAGGAQLTATNEFILSTYKLILASSEVSKERHRLIMPRSAVARLLEFLESVASARAVNNYRAGQTDFAPVKVKILLSEDKAGDLAFEVAEHNTKYFIQLKEGNYPDYTQLTQAPRIGRMVFNPAELAAYFERFDLKKAVCFMFRPNDFKTLEIAVTAKQLPTITPEAPQSAWGFWARDITDEGIAGAWEKCNVNIKLDEGTLYSFALDARLVLAACRNLPRGTKTALIELAAASNTYKPNSFEIEEGKYYPLTRNTVLIRPFGVERLGTIHLIMPMHLAEL